MSEDWERVTKADLIAIYDAVPDPITERFGKTKHRERHPGRLVWKMACFLHEGRRKYSDLIPCASNLRTASAISAYPV